MQIKWLVRGMDREKMLEAAKKGVQKAYSRKDLMLMQSVKAIDEMDASKSAMFTHLKEWNKIVFPELELENEESYCRVAMLGEKAKIKEKDLEAILGREKAAEVFKASRNSFGAKADERDLEKIGELAGAILEMFAERARLEKYVEAEAEKEFKNISFLAGPVIGTRLVTLAGGLDRLAKMPSSTIQVLGAEKALFKHLIKGTKPPKHGILFQVPMVRTASREERGRIARSLAAKIAIAAKADYYTKEFIAPQLMEQLKK